MAFGDTYSYKFDYSRFRAIASGCLNLAVSWMQNANTGLGHFALTRAGESAFAETTVHPEAPILSGLAQFDNSSTPVRCRATKA